DFKRPDPAATAGYSQSIPASGSANMAYGAEVADDWYELFHSEALNALVHQALTDNPDLEAARHGLVAAQWELKAISGSALPQIDASGQIAREHVNASTLLRPVHELT